MERIADRSGFGGISFVELCMTFDIDLEEQPFHAQTVSYLICWVHRTPLEIGFKKAITPMMDK